MEIFIRSASCISPQETFNGQLFYTQPKEYNHDILHLVEPNYKNIIEVRSLRRMSRIIRIGVVAAMQCLKEAGKENTDAIITGTAYGCMEDSENFLKKIVEQDEEMLSPTSFIQTTHNMVGAQIALMLKCHGYNNTIVHKGFSFEHALIDSMLFLKENQAQHVLTGTTDEITEFTFSVLRRFGFYKQSPVSNLDLFNSKTKGSIAGLGSAFFLLSNQPTGSDYAKLDAVETFYRPAGIDEIKKYIRKFLSFQKISEDDIDLVITGRNGDPSTDSVYNNLNRDIFKGIPCINYKHLCGEYPTSSSFAIWLASNIIRLKQLPLCFANEVSLQKPVQKILIYNNYQSRYHSLMLISSCDK
jgi:3-oxoacyl-[acyl-carrier-protein] synthase II